MYYYLEKNRFILVPLIHSMPLHVFTVQHIFQLFGRKPSLSVRLALLEIPLAKVVRNQRA
jgi:hypothetical protein